MGAGKKKDGTSKGRKVHLEIFGENGRNLGQYLETYNGNPLRITPKFKIADVVNLALFEYLSRQGVEIPSAQEGPLGQDQE